MTDQSHFLAFLKGAGFEIQNDYPDHWAQKDMIVVQKVCPGGVLELQLISNDIISDFCFDEEGNFIEHMNEDDE
jgi:hypothetical protein